MATMERGRSPQRHYNDSEKSAEHPAHSAVPTPFPLASPGLQQQQRTDSRSPSTTRRASLSRGVGGIMDKVKRVMSASRERSSSGNEQHQRDESRGRRAEPVDTNFTDEPRGRAGQLSNTNTLTGSTLHATDTRSTSRGRAMLSTGRGGAGNMRGVAEGEEDELNLDGDEKPEVMARARAEVERERSESRERTGREEMVGSGRGGKGNYRSTSRGRELDLGRVPTVQEEQEQQKVKSELEREREVMEMHLAKRNQERAYTTGRGGAGNIRSN